MKSLKIVCIIKYSIINVPKKWQEHLFLKGKKVITKHKEKPYLHFVNEISDQNVQTPCHKEKLGPKLWAK